MWIGDGLVRRVAYDLALRTTAEEQAKGLTDPRVSLLIEYYDFGVPFDTVMPAAG